MIVTIVKYNQTNNNNIFIDVRSPLEYKDDTIFNAINIPLLDDEERKFVGTTYKQIGKIEAKRLGVQLVSPKMENFFEQVMKLKKSNSYELIAFCARGGYRSTFFASVFSSIGIHIAKLEGGYKEYRREVISSLPLMNEDLKYIVIHGNTGVGKTEILHSLKDLGFDVLDLEGAANHRGSILGNIGMGKCNSQKTFESNIYNQLRDIKSKYVFVEAESQKIGYVVIPKYISDKMKQGNHIFVEANIDYRVEILKNDYIKNENWKNESIEAIGKMKKYNTKIDIQNLEEQVLLGNFEYVAKELMEKYYDPKYNFRSDKLKYDNEFKAVSNSDVIAQEIGLWLESCNKNK